MKWVLGIIAVIVLAIYGYVRLHVYSQTFQFRMTMTVSTPEGEKSASSVIAVYLPRDMRTQRVTGIVRGTTYGIAPMVDLGQHGILIAALESYGIGDTEAARLSPTGHVPGSDSDRLVLAAYDIDRSAVDVSKAWRGGKRILREDVYPQIIWIPPGTEDPKRARALHPATIPQMIGADVRITSIAIAPTRDRVIERVPNAPEWLRAIRRQQAIKPGYIGNPSFFTLRLEAVETSSPKRED